MAIGVDTSLYLNLHKEFSITVNSKVAWMGAGGAIGAAIIIAVVTLLNASTTKLDTSSPSITYSSQGNQLITTILSSGNAVVEGGHE